MPARSSILALALLMTGLLQQAVLDDIVLEEDGGRSGVEGLNHEESQVWGNGREADAYAPASALLEGVDQRAVADHKQNKDDGNEDIIDPESSSTGENPTNNAVQIQTANETNTTVAESKQDEALNAEKAKGVQQENTQEARNALEAKADAIARIQIQTSEHTKTNAVMLKAFANLAVHKYPAGDSDHLYYLNVLGDVLKDMATHTNKGIRFEIGLTQEDFVKHQAQLPFAFQAMLGTKKEVRVLADNSKIVEVLNMTANEEKSVKAKAMHLAVRANTDGAVVGGAHIESVGSVEGVEFTPEEVYVAVMQRLMYANKNTGGLPHYILPKLTKAMQGKKGVITMPGAGGNVMLRNGAVGLDSSEHFQGVVVPTHKFRMELEKISDALPSMDDKVTWGESVAALAPDVTEVTELANKKGSGTQTDKTDRVLGIEAAKIKNAASAHEVHTKETATADVNAAKALLEQANSADPADGPDPKLPYMNVYNQLVGGSSAKQVGDPLLTEVTTMLQQLSTSPEAACRTARSIVAKRGLAWFKRVTGVAGMHCGVHPSRVLSQAEYHKMIARVKAITGHAASVTFTPRSIKEVDPSNDELIVANTHQPAAKTNTGAQLSTAQEKAFQAMEANSKTSKTAKKHAAAAAAAAGSQLKMSEPTQGTGMLTAAQEKEFRALNTPHSIPK